MQSDVELVIDSKALLGEGPCWDSNTNKLFWVDILGKKLHVFNPISRSTNSFDVGQYIGAAVMRESGGLLLALEHGFYTFNIETNELTPIIDPESHLSSNRFNDGKCDSYGRFWAGTMALNASKEQGSLYCMNTDMTVRKVLPNVTISNGIAWNEQKQKMYFIDTGVYKVFVFDFDSQTGKISNQQVAITIEKEHGGPDGMTIDDEGMLWIAHWGGSKVARWNPDNGELLAEVKVPASQVTSCTFGGKNKDELYITTARTGLTEEQLKDQPLAGGVFLYHANVTGAHNYKFKG